jgi:Lipocalin-like domain
MNSRLLLAVVALFSLLVSAQSTQSVSDGRTEVQNHLVGAWKLVSLEEPGPNGQLHQADCAGMFVFTSDGKAAVQVMYRNADTGSAYAHGGYEASYGSYRIDSSSIFTFHIEGALVRALIGKDLKRAFEISGKQLTIKSTDANEHWRVVWEHD